MYIYNHTYASRINRISSNTNANALRSCADATGCGVDNAVDRLAPFVLVVCRTVVVAVVVVVVAAAHSQPPFSRRALTADNIHTQSVHSRRARNLTYTHDPQTFLDSSRCLPHSSPDRTERRVCFTFRSPVAHTAPTMAGSTEETPMDTNENSVSERRVDKRRTFWRALFVASRYIINGVLCSCPRRTSPRPPTRPHR